MTDEVKKHPSLEPLNTGDIIPPPEPIANLYREEATTSVASLEKQHEANQTEKQRLTKIKQLLETDEADLAELRKQIFAKILQRMGKE